MSKTVTPASSNVKRPMRLMPAHFMVDELRHRGYEVRQPQTDNAVVKKEP